MEAQVKKAMFVHDTEWYPLIGTDGAGDKTFADIPTIIKTYQTGKHTLVRNLQGEQVLSTQQIYIDGDVSVKIGELLKPLGTQIKYSIIQLEPFYKGASLDYMIAYLK